MAAGVVVDSGVPGASARREYERRSARERRGKEAIVAEDAAWREQVTQRHPILGRVATVLTPQPVIGPESQQTRAWDEGAVGEELVGPILESVEGVIVLHDRRIPKSKANIDHLVVTSRGIFIVDPKNYDGAVHKQDVGGWLRADERLVVNGRDRTKKVIEGMLWQVDTVRRLLDDLNPSEDIPIHGVICFVGPNWRRFLPRAFSVRGVQVMWPAKVVELLKQPGTVSRERMEQLGRRLDEVLRPA